AANGDDRFPSMPALLRTLHQRRRGPSWLWWGGAAALGVASLSTLRSGEHPCEASVSIDDIWNEAHSDRTRRAFTATALPFAPHAAERVSGMLDSYATQWRLTQRAVCELRAPSAEALATQRACLEQRARELAALADLLEAPSTSVVLHAVGAAHRLRQPAECIQPGVAVLEGAPHLLEELASLRADDLAGGGRSAIPRAEALLEQASAAGDGAIFAEARFIQGRFLERAGEYAAAREALEDAFHRAVALGDDGLAARAATMLVTVDGIRRLNPDKAAGWARHGLAALDRTDSPLVRASLLVARGGAATTSGRFEDATADYEAALSLLTSELSEDEFSIAATLNNLATVHARLGDYDAAESELTRALASFERDLGTAHPSVAATIANLAALQTDRGNHEAALETLLEASQRLTAALGRDHPTVAKNETNIGLAYLRLGRLSEAERHLGDALEIRKRVLRADHPEIGYAHTNRGHARAEDERWAAAASDYRKAIDILSAEFGVHDARVADPTRGLADVELAQGDWRAASALAEGALRSIDFTGHPATETALRDVVERALTRSRDAL
ncbi:MAG: tetratricopeptide repeat protein, partial [Myxococcota bacterium]